MEVNLHDLKGGKFDELLETLWTQHRNKGHFKYKFVSPVSQRILNGDYGFLVQLNPDRREKRRDPVIFESVNQKFDPLSFHFGHIDEEKELLFQFPVSNSIIPALIINVSPLEMCHSLLIFKKTDGFESQVLTLQSLLFALQIMFVSKSPAIKLAFNSLCAGASVNHLHWHIYYLSLNSLYISSAPLKHLFGSLYLLLHYSAPSFVFLIQHDFESKRVSQEAYKLLSLLTLHEIPHNVFMTKDENKGVRIFVWARKKLFTSKSHEDFVIAVCEIAGHIVIYNEEKYKGISEKEIVEKHQELVTETFEHVLNHILPCLLSSYDSNIN